MTIKNKINKVAVYALCCVFGLTMVSCEDFLDRPPLTQFEDEEFWQNEAQTRAFVMQIYPIMFPGYGGGLTDIGTPTTFMFAGGADDMMSGATQTELGPFTVPDTDPQWNQASWGNVRRANHIIANVHRVGDLDEAGMNHWIGVGRFYRAFLYSNKVFRFGNVPWIDRVPVAGGDRAEREFIFQDSRPRTYVVARIMEDFEFAMEHVRANDGLLQINRYVVAAMATRLLLREGTFLRYHEIDDEKAVEVLQLARRAAQLVMSNSNFRISDSYRALFNSLDLAGNPEIIMFRRYQVGVMHHSMMTASTSQSIHGASRAFAESFSLANGLPVLWNNPTWQPQTAEEFFAGRDPRLSMILRPRYFVRGAEGHGFVSSSFSGFSIQKFADDERFDPTRDEFQPWRNVTDAPVLRLGEVLINYAEIVYELGELDQAALDRSLNLLRGRPGVNMPPLMIAGNMPMVSGIIYDDPMRLKMNPDDDVSPILWEIRRERRVELGHEGFRMTDLRRWRKLDYLFNTINPRFRYGVYIRFSDFNPNQYGIPDIADDIRIATTTTATGGMVYHVGYERARFAAWQALPEATRPPFEPNPVTSGFILGNWQENGYRTNMPTPRNYIYPVPNGQIVLYHNNGFPLSQHPVWVD